MKVSKLVVTYSKSKPANKKTSITIPGDNRLNVIPARPKLKAEGKKRKSGF